MREPDVLQAVRLKGRAEVARCTGSSEADAQVVLDKLVAEGLVKGGPAVRITPQGRERLMAAAEDLSDEGTAVVLVRPTTDPDDVSE